MAMKTDTGIDDLSTCSICLEKMTNPKYLSCLHTFCESCILTYITSGFEKDKTGIHCPVCRRTISVPYENCSPEEWTKQLPVNFLIVGLMEKAKVQRPEKRCMICERLDIESDAKYLCLDCSDALCDNCYKYHKSNKASSGHEMKPLSDVNSSDKIPKAFRNKCSEHTSKKLKLFCVDHDKPCCSMCVSITHRKCDRIIAIEDAAKTFRSSSVFQEAEETLQNCSEDFSAIVAQYRNGLEDLEKQYQSKVNAIETACKDIIRNARTFKDQRKAEILKIYNGKKDVLETEIVKYENRQKAIENDKQILRVSNEKASEVQCMLETRKIVQQLEEHKQELKTKILKFQLTFENADEVVKIAKQLECAFKVNCEDTHISVELLSKFGGISDKICKINRFSSITGEWYMSSSDYVNAIAFSVSEEIFLVGILSFQLIGESSCSITLSIQEGDKIVTETTTTADKRKIEQNMLDIELPEPVKLKMNTKYDAIFRTNEATQKIFYRGDGGKSEVDCDGVIFKFEESNSNKSSTCVLRGQIPGFLFRKVK